MAEMYVGTWKNRDVEEHEIGRNGTCMGRNHVLELGEMEQGWEMITELEFGKWTYGDGKPGKWKGRKSWNLKGRACMERNPVPEMGR